MRSHVGVPRRRIQVLLAATALVPLFARAATDTWNTSSGNWSLGTNWSLGVVPGNTDSAFLRDPGANPITITFDASAIATNLANVWVDSTGTSLVTFSQSVNTLTTFNEIVGSNGAGVLLLNGGTHNISSSLLLGNTATGSGTITLSAGLLSVNSMSVGVSGSGVVNQSGGTATIAALTVGQSTNNAVYNLTGGTIDSSSIGEYIGYVGRGSFNQSGGTNLITGLAQLLLGANTGAFGTYNLSNGATLTLTGTGNAELVGTAASGVFNQTGGVHNVSNGTLGIGFASAASGTMNLSGGTLNALGLTVGFNGKGFFNQSGGTATVGSLVLGSGTGTGSFSLSNGASFTATSGATIGSSGMGTYMQTGGTFNQPGSSQTLQIALLAGSAGTATVSGGSLTVGGAITVGNAGLGVFNQSGGTVTVPNVNIGITGTNGNSYNLSGGTLVPIDKLLVGNGGVGTFNHTGGSVTAFQLFLGQPSNSSGFYTLSGTATLSASSSETIGSLGSGVFTQNAGSNTTPTLTLAAGTASSGVYNLNGGLLNVTTKMFVGSANTGVVNQTGGTAQLNKLSIGSTFNPAFAGQFQGSYTLAPGATLNVPNGEAVGDAGSGLFTQNGGTHTVGRVLSIGNLSVSGNSFASGEYTLNDGTLTSPQLQVGLETNGNFFQYGGTSTVSGNVYIADGTLIFSGTPYIYGSYIQTGGITTVGGYEFVGGVGGGTLSIGGGTHTISHDLELGYASTSTSFAQGVLDISGGTLNVADGEYVGVYTSGYLNQVGGSHTAGSLSLGYHAGATGAASLAFGTLTVLGDEIIGVSGAGSFAQSDGLHSVGGLLTIQSPSGGTTAVGTYTLTGGTLTAAVANFGTMTLGGTATFNGSLTNSGTLILNTFTGSILAAVTNQGTVLVNSDFTFAGGFEHDGSPIAIGNHALLFNGPGLNNFSTVTLSNGKLGGSGPILNNAQISGFGTLTGTGGIVNNGNLSVTGGTLIVADPLLNTGNLFIDTAQSLRLTSPLTNTGSITFGSGSFINGTALLSNSPGGVITGPGLIGAPLSNAGTLAIPTGSLNVTQPFANSGIINLTSISAGLSGGGVTNTGTIQGLGSVSSPVVNLGTIEAIGGTLSIASLTNTASGILRVSTSNKILLTGSGAATNTGTISLVGGTFDTNGKPLVNAGSITGFGTLATGGLTNNPGQAVTFTGGLTTINGSVNNLAGGTIRVSYTPAIFTHPVTNSGTIKITSTTVTFAAPFTNNGLYSSDPAVTRYTDLTIGPNGALAGGAGDQFFISGDFRSNSMQRSLWNTADGAELHFQSGGSDTHLVTLTGSDLGPTASGYEDNFAWGIVSIDAGQTLTLADGDTTSGGALYTSILNLAGAPTDGTLASFISTHFLNADNSAPLDIYYDPAQPANAYLRGATYALGNGGVLAAVTSVPEPSSIAIALSGAAFLRRRRRR